MKMEDIIGGQMKVRAEVTPESAGTWNGYHAIVKLIDGREIERTSRLSLTGIGQTPEEAIENLKKSFERTRAGLVEFEVEDL